MGRGAIVIGLAAVIISEVVFGAAVHIISRCKLLAVALGAVIYYVVHSGGAVAGTEHELMLKLFCSAHGGGACSWPFPYWKEQAGCARKSEGRQLTMLDI